MPEANLEAFSLEGKSAAELEQRRREIVSRYGRETSVDDMTIADLRELASITGALRGKTTTAMKAKKAAAGPRKKKSPSSTDDIFNAI